MNPAEPIRVLFVTWDGGGNLPPALGIARELRARGDEVRILGHEVQRTAIEESRLGFTPIRTGRDYVSAEPRGTVGGVLGLSALFADRGIGDDALALLAEWPADAVVVDCLLWGAQQQLERSGVRVVSLVHSLSAFFDANARGPLGLIARLRGTDAVAAGRGAALELVTTRPEFEPVGRARDTVRHVGFVWQGEPVAAVRDASRPRVLVSFSTTSFPGQQRAFQRVLDALADQQVEVVATTGAVDPGSLRAPRNAVVVRRLDHDQVLPTASLVIGHGGHATTARALAAGVPVLAMPMHPLMDQPLVGRALERLGVGATLPKTASAERIRSTARRLLDDPVVADSAARLGQQVRAADGATAAADQLRHLAKPNPVS